MLSVVSKVMERAVHSQLYGYFEESNLISDFQFGFNKGNSIEQAIATLKVDGVLVDILLSNTGLNKRDKSLFVRIPKVKLEYENYRSNFWE